jgi:hypothetical protein
VLYVGKDLYLFVKVLEASRLEGGLDMYELCRLATHEEDGFVLVDSAAVRSSRRFTKRSLEQSCCKCMTISHALIQARCLSIYVFCNRPLTCSSKSGISLGANTVPLLSPTLMTSRRPSSREFDDHKEVWRKWFRIRNFFLNQALPQKNNDRHNGKQP